MYETVSTIILVIFVLQIVVAFGRIGKRFIDYFSANLRPPLLAIRDLALMGGLAFPFLAILTVRALGLTNFTVGQVWWALITGIPAILAMATFLYFEFFVIERTTDEVVRAYLDSPSAMEDKDFGDKRRELEAEHVEESLQNGSST